MYLITFWSHYLYTFTVCLTLVPFHSRKHISISFLNTEIYDSFLEEKDTTMFRNIYFPRKTSISTSIENITSMSSVDSYLTFDNRLQTSEKKQ